nr:MAG TPA: hypothetical protein [Caudoviricetes sp.]
MAYNNPTPEIYRGDIFYIMQGSYDYLNKT